MPLYPISRRLYDARVRQPQKLTYRAYFYMRLENKIAIVTGAYRGIGYAVARKFLDQGATVVMTDIADANQELQAFAAAHASRVRLLQMDVGSGADVHNAIGEILAEFGRIDILINNAGVEFYKPITTTTEQEWDQLMGVNLKGVFLCSKAVIPAMRQSGGAIVNVASELGLVGEANVAAYCASKGGVVMLSKAMAIDHGSEGIRVNCLCPGPVSTELMDGVFQASDEPEEMRRSFEQRILLNRLGTPDEVADAAVFLASSESAFMTGANLVLDGGWTAR